MTKISWLTRMLITNQTKQLQKATKKIKNKTPITEKKKKKLLLNTIKSTKDLLDEDAYTKEEKNIMNTLETQNNKTLENIANKIIKATNKYLRENTKQNEKK